MKTSLYYLRIFLSIFKYWVEKTIITRMAIEAKTRRWYWRFIVIISITEICVEGNVLKMRLLRHCYVKSPYCIYYGTLLICIFIVICVFGCDNTWGIYFYSLRKYYCCDVNFEILRPYFRDYNTINIMKFRNILRFFVSRNLSNNVKHVFTYVSILKGEFLLFPYWLFVSQHVYTYLRIQNSLYAVLILKLEDKIGKRVFDPWLMEDNILQRTFISNHFFATAISSTNLKTCPCLLFNLHWQLISKKDGKNLSRNLSW